MSQALDIENPQALEDYLRRSGRVSDNERVEVRTLAGGVSNRTVLVRLSGSKSSKGESWVLKQALDKLRVEVDWFSDPERVHREALGLRWLGELAPEGTTTPLIFEDYEHHLLAMRAVPEPHENWKVMLLEGRLERNHVEQFGRLLAYIHRNASDRRDELAEVFEDRSFFESLRLEPYYGYTAGKVTEAVSFLSELIEETRAPRETLVHGDYSPKNILIHDDKLMLLDHEVIHYGDPAFDLGFSLTHFLSKAHHLPEKRCAFMEAAGLYWSVYREEIGHLSWTRDLEERTVRHTLGCLLARVAGRSPLEYLDEGELARQKEAAIALMYGPPESVPVLIESFAGRL